MVFLNHYGWETHIRVSKLIIVGSNNGLSPGRAQATIWMHSFARFFFYFWFKCQPVCSIVQQISSIDLIIYTQSLPSPGAIIVCQFNLTILSVSSKYEIPSLIILNLFIIGWIPLREKQTQKRNHLKTFSFHIVRTDDIFDASPVKDRLLCNISVVMMLTYFCGWCSVSWV